MGNELTEEAFWSNYWDHVRLPAEIVPGAQGSLFTLELCRHFETYLPKGANLTALEVGGAPGQYLVYMHRALGYRVSCLDYSDIGCRKTRENFDLLGLPVEVMRGDILDDNLSLPLYDVVYSLGLIEHFADPWTITRRHLKFLKPGGTLMIGVPNLLGINHWFRKRLDPHALTTHNLAAMELDDWKAFEEPEHLEVVFKGYIGGLEPSVLDRCETKTLRNFPVRKMAKVLDVLLRKRCRFLRRFNSRSFSGYALAVYRKPAADRGGPSS